MIHDLYLWFLSIIYIHNLYSLCMFFIFFTYLLLIFTCHLYKISPFYIHNFYLLFIFKFQYIYLYQQGFIVVTWNQRLMMRCPINLKTLFSKDTLLNSYDCKKEMTFMFNNLAKSLKYFVWMNLLWQIQLFYLTLKVLPQNLCTSSSKCSYFTSLVIHLKIFVRVAANAAVPVSQLPSLVQTEPSHKMCHLGDGVHKKRFFKRASPV